MQIVFGLAIISVPSGKLTSRSYGWRFEMCLARIRPAAAVGNRMWSGRVDSWHPGSEASHQCMASEKHGYMEACDKPIECPRHPSIRRSYLGKYPDLFQSKSKPLASPRRNGTRGTHLLCSLEPQNNKAFERTKVLSPSGLHAPLNLAYACSTEPYYVKLN